jgi:hypothetical protein
MSNKGNFNKNEAIFDTETPHFVLWHRARGLSNIDKLLHSLEDDLDTDHLMMGDSMIRVHFEIHEGFWILIHFESGDNTFAVATSGIVYDSLLALAEAPLSFAQWGEGRGLIDDVPLVYEIVLLQKEDHAVLKIFELPDVGSFSESGPLVFQVEDSPQAFLLAFWRGLRNLESRFTEIRWRYDFPSKAVERLGVVAKKSANSE